MFHYLLTNSVLQETREDTDSIVKLYAFQNIVCCSVNSAFFLDFLTDSIKLSIVIDFLLIKLRKVKQQTFDRERTKYS